jgi:glycosyltransferase involved in cell wall biosynthesis
MKISIVTISFNQARFLEQAISSVLEQDHPNVEYLVVDPGSTDGSREIIERHRDRIDKIIFEPDRGPADGLNKGFAHAAGEVFGFLNSDDILEPGALSGAARYFETHPEVDVVSGHSWIIDADGRKKRRFYSDRFSLRMVAYGACILAQPSTFFRSEIFRRAGGFNIDNRSNWDAELFVDMVLAGARFALERELWSQYRVHDEGITGSGKLQALHQRHRERMFRKIMGRESHRWDALLAIGACYMRKIFNFSDTAERLRHGAIYHSTKQSR